MNHDSWGLSHFHVSVVKLAGAQGWWVHCTHSDERRQRGPSLSVAVMASGHTTEPDVTSDILATTVVDGNGLSH